MKFKKTISLLVICIVVLSLISSIIGIFSFEGRGEYEFRSINGERVNIYGKGIYKRDSISIVAQGKAQDIVTIVIGIPLLLLSLFLSSKGLLKGRFLLTGTLGYFLYTYITYVFLWMYNPLFLVYVTLMSLSFFAFTLTMMSFNLKSIKFYFNENLPVRFLGGFQIIFAVAVAMLWIGKIVPSLLNGTMPSGLDHYNTLVIQGIDLGFIVPVAFLSGILIIKRKPFGYLLSTVIIMKGFTMGLAITAMIIGQALAGVQMNLVEMTMFPIISLIIVFCLVIILRNINERGSLAK